MARALLRTGLMLILPLVAAGCSTDSEAPATDGSAETTMSPTDDGLSPGINDGPQPGQPEPSVEATEASPTADESEDADEEDVPGLPSHDDVTSGLRTMIVAELGLAEDEVEDLSAAGALEEYYSCITDQVYDTLSADALQALADADLNAELSVEDSAIFNEATTTCGELITAD